MDFKTNKLGTFEVKSGKLIITDPCYDKGTWCQGILDNVANGEWVATNIVSDSGFGWGEIVFELEARHKDYRGCIDIPCSFEVGVDSGQAGMFDEANYPDKKDNGDFDDADFYENSCQLTCDTPTKGGIINFGCVSRSGYGDGNYTAYIAKNEEDQIVAVKIVFIDENVNEDDEDDDSEN